MLGDLGRRVRVARGQHAVAVDGREPRHAAARAGRDQYEIGFDLFVARVRGRDDAPRPGETARAPDHAHALRHEQRLDRLLDPALDRLHPLAKRVDVESAFRRDAHGVRALQLRELAAGRDQRLRRDAVPEVRGAADDIAFDDRDVGTEGRGDTRARIAGRTTTDHDEMRHAHEVTTANGASGPRNLSFMSAQTEVRYDALSDRTVIVATGRDRDPTSSGYPTGIPIPAPSTARSARATSP